MSYECLDLNLLKTFASVYENGGIVIASKKMFVSQPAVTKSIKRLEEFLGGQLFVRTSKGIMPTSEADELYITIKNSLNLIKKSIENFKAYKNLDKGSLNIGSSSTLIRYLLIPYISIFSLEHSNINITITDGISSQLINYLKSGEIDLAILSMPIREVELFKITKITESNDCFIASTNFEKDYVDKMELKNYPLLVQKRPSNNRDYFEQMCLKNDIVLQPNYEMSSFGLITDFVEKGMGIGYTIKDYIKKDIEKGRVKEIKTNFEILPRDVVVLTPQNSVNNFVSKVFINNLVDYFKNWLKKLPIGSFFVIL